LQVQPAAAHRIGARAACALRRPLDARGARALTRRACVAVLCLAALAAAGPARAWIPEPERAWASLAKSNAYSGRTKPLDFAVALVDGGGNVVATGRLRSLPAGAATLELTLADGGTETHVRSGLDYRVTRDGQRVDRAPRLVPPLAVLQAGKSMEVAEELRAMAADPARIDLGIDGRFDCWVLGGRDPGDFEMNTRPSVWVDQETEQPVRIDDAGGVRYKLRDLSSKGGVRFPSRIEVHADGWPIWRIDVAMPAPQDPAIPTTPRPTTP
jgi:hypothetical protein